MGAEVLPEVGVRFRVWAPKARSVHVVVNGKLSKLNAEGEGYFTGIVADAGAGDDYSYQLDGGPPRPDPASRFQPDGPHGPSRVVDPGSYEWKDAGWQGISAAYPVIYELHVGTFSGPGTWAGAEEKLALLQDLGVDAVEVMPVAECPGAFNWGYDGVSLFSPGHNYGEPDDFRGFVDRAHALGLGVILDVVYNHLGPAGNYLSEFSPDYFSRRYPNEWSQAINFDGENSEAVRAFFLQNACHWISEYHLDGLRLDATQQMFDSSAQHILAEITSACRQSAGTRRVLLIAESEAQNTKLVRPAVQGGYGMDAAWNDDFHHVAAVALSAHNEAYYSDYLGVAREFVSCAKWGYLYQGQWYSWQQQRRGTPSLDLAPHKFVNYLENHDQIANSAHGKRLYQRSSPGRYRAVLATCLLTPGLPMLFQGAEFFSSSPFLFFADHARELSVTVLKGRRKFLEQFASADAAFREMGMDDPGSRGTFERCKLNWEEHKQQTQALALHKDLLRLRKDPDVSLCAGRIDGSAISDHVFVLRSLADGDDRLLLVNLGRDLNFAPASEPLLAAPVGKRWSLHWSSEDVRYGGAGSRHPDTGTGWRFSGESAQLLIATPEGVA